jgi:predicted Zn-dependent protease
MTDPLTHAVELLKAGKPADAEPLLRAAHEAKPDDPRPAELLGRCLMGLSRAADAEPLIRRWAEATGDARAWSYLAQVRYVLGDRAGSHAAAMKALSHPAPDAG